VSPSGEEQLNGREGALPGGELTGERECFVLLGTGVGGEGAWGRTGKKKTYLKFGFLLMEVEAVQIRPSNESGWGRGADKRKAFLMD